MFVVSSPVTCIMGTNNTHWYISSVYVYLSVATETHHTNNNGDIFDNMANSE